MVSATRVSTLLLVLCTLAIHSNSGVSAAPGGGYGGYERLDSATGGATRPLVVASRPGNTRYYQAVVSKQDPNELRNILSTRRDIDAGPLTAEEESHLLARYEGHRAANAVQYGEPLDSTRTLKSLKK